MANLYQFMSSMFPDNAGGYGGGGGNEQEDAYYRAQLQEWLRQQKYQEVLDERAYQEDQANSLADYLPSALDQAMQTSGYQAPEATSAGLEVLKAFINSRNPGVLGAINQMAAKSQAGLVSAGTPTQAYKDFQLAQQNEAYAKDREQLRQLQLPATLQTADALAQAAGRQERTTADIMDAGKIMTPDRAAAMEAAKTGAVEDTKAVINGVTNTPQALDKYDEMIGQTRHMTGTIQFMRNKLKEDPSIIGWKSFLTKYVPESDAKSFEGLKQSLVSGLALENMAKLKQLSATGATGLGSTSWNEIQILQDNIAKLDTASDPATVMRALDQIETVLTKLEKGATESYVQDAMWLEHHKQYAPRSYREPKKPVNPITGTFTETRDAIGSPPPQQPVPSGRFKLLR